MTTLGIVKWIVSGLRDLHTTRSRVLSMTTAFA